MCFVLRRIWTADPVRFLVNGMADGALELEALALSPTFPLGSVTADDFEKIPFLQSVWQLHACPESRVSWCPPGALEWYRSWLQTIGVPLPC